LTVFAAPKKEVPTPAMIVCPRGGYSYVVHDKEGTKIVSWLNSTGMTAPVLKYCCPNNRAGERPGTLQSLRDRWLAGRTG
jgi:hypothetical protein